MAEVLLSHLLLLAIMAVPVVLGMHHAARDREAEEERRRVRCLSCGRVVGHRRECLPHEHLPDLRS